MTVAYDWVSLSQAIAKGGICTEAYLGEFSGTVTGVNEMRRRIRSYWSEDDRTLRDFREWCDQQEANALIVEGFADRGLIEVLTLVDDLW